MEHKTLSMVADITQQNDVDSLNQSFLVAIAELIPCHSISLYQTSQEHDTQAEELLRLDISNSQQRFFCHQWRTNQHTIFADAPLSQCLEQGKVVHYQKASLHISLFPISSENKITAAIKISGPDTVQGQLALLKNLLKIYQNYLFILNESERDKLTGIFNRRTFDKKLAKLLTRQRDQQQDYSAVQQQREPQQESNAWLAILDIDFFKRVNDDYGHLYGDEVLLLLSQQMKSFFRSSDLLFRFGGEEFVIVLEPIPEEMAAQTLERFRHSIEQFQFPSVGNITISIGYSKIREHDYPPTVLEQADQALYYAKEHGRNAVFGYQLLISNQLLQRPQQEEGSVDLFF
ncbi:MAG: GGDEF domain-containing protein [Gammaproteobacteria bacterium]|nr:GGDEF domain-containing protein [Gammaproteobacteria bacterium]